METTPIKRSRRTAKGAAAQNNFVADVAVLRCETCAEFEDGARPLETGAGRAHALISRSRLAVKFMLPSNTCVDLALGAVALRIAQAEAQAARSHGIEEIPLACRERGARIVLTRIEILEIGVERGSALEFYLASNAQMEAEIGA